ncbi:uncharacterized protein DUF664 [Kribbella antiqua]|uniref:Uncharacterized protein DUF664 n=2 Tax=Kribbella antiqua TaxID=2512217 RepID=A0A4R2J066_9ACTN|nr:uncharacterized protein DUF664 [Kribbella antiqua]
MSSGESGTLNRMIDDFAKAYLHDDLRWVRESLLFKLDGLTEYDVRRPLTKTGTNLLGLIKHLTLSEARYFGEIFDRPYPERLPRFDDPGYANRDHLWVTEQESRADIVEGYKRAWQHADATIEALPIDAPGFVPWWPRPNVKLFNVMVHVLTETNRHAGNADILREQLDGGVGAGPVTTSDDDWDAHRSKIEKAAREAQLRDIGPGH